MSSSDIYKNNFKNIKKYVDDLYYKSTKGIRTLIIDVVNSLGVMKKSTYDKNEDGIVDNSEKVVLTNQSQSVTDTTIRFGVNSEGKWGYIKEGADTVYPFKADPNLQAKTVHPTSQDQVVEPDEEYDGLSDVTVEGMDLQTKSVYPYGGSDNNSIIISTPPQTEYPAGNALDLGDIRVGLIPSDYQVVPDEGYDGLLLVNIEQPNLQSKSITPSASQQVVTPDSGYVALSQVTVGAAPPPSGNINIGTYNTNGTYSNINVSGYATCSVTIAVPSPAYQTKTVSPTTSQQVITPDSGYDALSQVTVNAVSLTTKTVTPSTSQQTVTPGSGYIGLSRVTVNAINLQSKSVDASFPLGSQGWSDPYTGYHLITKDSGYDGMSEVNVREAFLRDNQLVKANGVITPSTYYNNDTAVSNTAKMLKVSPTKTGHAETQSEWVVAANSYFGNATASDVAQGKTFSSSAGIQVTGTSTAVTPTGNVNLGTFSSNQTVTGKNVSGYATCSFTISVPSASLQAKTETLSPGAAYGADYTAYTTYSPDSGYDGLSYVQVRTASVRDNTLFTATSVKTPSTYYNGSTAVTGNTEKMLNIRPSKAGSIWTASDVVLKANSYFGNATAADVLQGKTFSSSAGIQVTGTSTAVTPTGNVDLGTFSLNQTVTGKNVSGYATCSFTIAVPNPGLSRTALWTNASPSAAFSAQTITLSKSYKNYSWIEIQFYSHKNMYNNDHTKILTWVMDATDIAAINNTSTNLFALAARSQSTVGATNGNLYARPFRFASNTSMYFATGSPIQASGGSLNTSTNMIIPYKVIGVDLA